MLVANVLPPRLATYLIRHAGLEDVKFKEGATAAADGAAHLLRRSEEEGIGRLGGGIPKAMEQWIVEGWLYIIIMSVVIGAIIGYGSMFAIKFGLRRKWIDSESLLLWPAAIGVSGVHISSISELGD
jgi:sodium/hydrogen antiporter